MLKCSHKRRQPDRCPCLHNCASGALQAIPCTELQRYRRIHARGSGRACVPFQPPACMQHIATSYGLCTTCSAWGIGCDSTSNSTRCAMTTWAPQPPLSPRHVCVQDAWPLATAWAAAWPRWCRWLGLKASVPSICLSQSCNPAPKLVSHRGLQLHRTSGSVMLHLQPHGDGPWGCN